MVWCAIKIFVRNLFVYFIVDYCHICIGHFLPMFLKIDLVIERVKSFQLLLSSVFNIIFKEVLHSFRLFYLVTVIGGPIVTTNLCCIFIPAIVH